MATSAVAREAVFALRREIARIEGVPPARLDAPRGPRPASAGDGAEAGIVTRRDGMPACAILPLGVAHLDTALAGGLPRAALTEIHGCETRDAGAVTGFALGLVALLSRRPATSAPVLWISAGEVTAEAGSPYPPGIEARFGIAQERLLHAGIRRVEDALWVAEEAAALTAFSAVLFELRGHARRLDLTATRRLHRRALASGRPVFLLRQAGLPEPTAAPVRLVVAPAPAGERRLLSGTLAGSIGPPAFAVTIARSRAGVSATAIVEWNADEAAFIERRADAGRTQGDGAVVSPPFDGTHPAPETGARVAGGDRRGAAA